MKTCIKCKEVKLFTEFYKHKNQKDGYHGKCKTCIKSYYEDNKNKISDRNFRYRAENKDQILTRKAEYRRDNKKKIAAYDAKYGVINRDKINAKHSKRRAAKLQATPAWLAAGELEQMRELYTCAQMFKLYTGQDYHVDHIVPLRGKNVCGLHVPWNLQVILAKENLSKSNKLIQD
jgi:5-methylcytosine-specific restriction endonuclease McrA